MKKNYIVIGLGRFGFSLAQTLYEMGHDVLAIDNSQELVESVSPYVTHAVQADATDEKSLRALGISNMDVAIICMGDDIKASILVTILCKEIGVATVIAKAQDELHGKVLSRIGADKVVYPERDMGIRVAQHLTCSNLLEYIDLSDEYSIAEIEVPKEWEERTITELDLRKRYGINVMAIKTPDDSLNINPSGDSVLKCKDTLVVIGSMHDIQNLEHASKRRK
ncbi:MAG: potassium channel family protein [Christensenellales bacterium]|jgi:trk system potassium uptake protein TrkA